MQEFTYLQNNSQRGFTLLETLMSMAVVSLVVTGVAFGTLQVMKYYIQDRDKLERENTTLLIKRMAVLANTQVNLRHFNVNRSYAKNNQKLSVSTETSDDIVWDVQSLLGQEGGGFLRARLGNVSSMSSLTVHNDSSTLRFFKLIKDGSSYRKALKNLVVSRCVLRDGGGVDPNGNTIDPNNPITSALYVVESLQMRPFIENVGGRIQIKCCPANQGPAVCTASNPSQWVVRMYKVALNDSDVPIAVTELPNPQESRQVLGAGFQVKFDSAADPQSFEISVFFRENMCSTVVGSSSDTRCRSKAGSEILKDRSLYQYALDQHSRVKTMEWTGSVAVPLSNTGVINLGF